MTDSAEETVGLWHRIKIRICPYIPMCGPHPRNDDAWGEWHEEHGGDE